MQDKFEKESDDFVQRLDKITKILQILVMILLMILTLEIFLVLMACNQNTSERDHLNEQTASSTISPEKETACTTYYITSEERDMLASLCTLEAGTCSQECKQAVVSVIFNRLHSKKWNKDINGDGKITLYDIIYYENAFSPASYIASTIGTKESYEAVDYVTRYGSTLPPKVRYFRDSYDFSWEGYRNYIVLDNIYFGYFENWQQGAW